MRNWVILLGIAGLIFLAGAFSTQNLAVNLSAGDVAAGERAVLESQANATDLAAQAQAEQAGQALADQTLVEDATRQARIDAAVTRAKVFRWFGGGAIALGLIIAVINIMWFFGTINYKLSTRMQYVSNGDGETMWQPFPLLPFVVVYTSRRAPGMTQWMTPFATPQITAPKEMALLALIDSLRAADDNRVEHGWHILSDMLNATNETGLARRQQE